MSPGIKRQALGRIDALHGHIPFDRQRGHVPCDDLEREDERYIS